MLDESSQETGVFEYRHNFDVCSLSNSAVYITVYVKTSLYDEFKVCALYFMQCQKYMKCDERHPFFHVGNGGPMR